MKVSELMAKVVRTCRPDDTLSGVARDMWDGDCGCVPVIDAEGRPIAMVTDRDICMAAFLTGEPLHRIPVKSASSQVIHTVRDNESIETASGLMREHRVRRLPVVDDGGRLVGVLSTADLVRRAAAQSNGAEHSHVTWTLSGISEPWKTIAPPPVRTVHLETRAQA